MYYKTIWVITLAHLLLYFFQEMSFTVGTISGTDLGNLIRLNYSRKMAIFLWFSSELAIIAADVQEVLGATIAMKILFGCNLYFGETQGTHFNLRLDHHHFDCHRDFVFSGSWSEVFRGDFRNYDFNNVFDLFN